MLRHVKEGLARLINREDQAAGHAWESRFQDVRLLDAGGVLACLVYVDLNPVRAGMVTDPGRSRFCSSAHRHTIQGDREDAPLATCLWRLDGTMLIDDPGQRARAWAWASEDLDDLTRATARLITRFKRQGATPRVGLAPAAAPGSGSAPVGRGHGIRREDVGDGPRPCGGTAVLIRYRAVDQRQERAVRA